MPEIKTPNELSTITSVAEGDLICIWDIDEAGDEKMKAITKANLFNDPTFSGLLTHDTDVKQVALLTTSQASQNNYVTLRTTGAASSIGVQMGKSVAGEMIGIRASSGSLNVFTGGDEGTVLDGTPSMTLDTSGNANFTGTGTFAGTLAINDPGSTADERAAHFFAANLPDGGANAIFLGMDATAFDSAIIRFYKASSGSSNNYLGLGVSGSNDVVKIFDNLTQFAYNMQFTGSDPAIISTNSTAKSIELRADAGTENRVIVTGSTHGTPNRIRFYTSDIERAYFDASGHFIHGADITLTSGSAKMDRSGTGGEVILSGGTSHTTGGAIVLTGSTSGSPNLIKLFTAGEEQARFTAAGRFGLGCDPSYFFQVNSNMENTFLFHDDLSAQIMSGTRSGIVFNDDSADKDFRIESDNREHAFFLQGSNGYIGIADSTPSYDLDVNGQIRGVDAVRAPEKLVIPLNEPTSLENGCIWIA